MRKNGIKEAEEVTLVDKNGRKWRSYVACAKQRRDFYMAKGWRRFCAANKLKTGETFTLEFVRGEGATPMLKFCSKAKVKVNKHLVIQVTFFVIMNCIQIVPMNCIQTEQEEAPEDTGSPFQKRARVSAEVGHSRRTQAPDKSCDDPKRKQPLQPCSISDQAKKVKQSIVNILTDIKRFRSELEIKEQNLEASLLGIDVLGTI